MKGDEFKNIEQRCYKYRHDFGKDDDTAQWSNQVVFDLIKRIKLFERVFIKYKLYYKSQLQKEGNNDGTN